jgi:hypothetical protein
MVMQTRVLQRAGLVLLLGVVGCAADSGPAAPLPQPTAGPTAPPTPGSSVAPPPANQPPRLDVRVTPTPISGNAPLTVNVNLCRSSDPDGDLLSYVYEYQGEGKRFAAGCEERHVYPAPVHSLAVFCVSDGMPRHLICRPFQVAID